MRSEAIFWVKYFVYFVGKWMIKDCLVTKQADLLKDWIIKLAFFLPSSNVYEKGSLTTGLAAGKHKQ